MQKVVGPMEKRRIVANCGQEMCPLSLVTAMQLAEKYPQYTVSITASLTTPEVWPLDSFSEQRSVKEKHRMNLGLSPTSW